MINVGGKELPCRLTMGAMLQFKRMTGRDVNQMDANDIEDMLMLMWCCIFCACKAEGIEFDTDFEMFTCMVTPQDVNQWNQVMGEADKEEKKARAGSNARLKE